MSALLLMIIVQTVGSANIHISVRLKLQCVQFTPRFPKCHYWKHEAIPGPYRGHTGSTVLRAGRKFQETCSYSRVPLQPSKSPQKAHYLLLFAKRNRKSTARATK